MTESIEQEQTFMPPPIVGGTQNAEFLRYLLDTDDPIANLKMELTGSKVVYDNKGKPALKQVSPPLANPALCNKIFTFIQTYNSKGFITTNLQGKEIDAIVLDVGESVIDLLEMAKSYSTQNWKNNPVYTSHYPSFMQGAHQQILLLVEHSVYATLKRSINAITLNKVTGMHTSQEIRSDTQQAKRQGILGGIGFK